MNKKIFSDIPRIEFGRVTLRRLEDADVPALEELASSEAVYRFEPTYLFERQYSDMRAMLRDLYGKCFAAKESLILGVQASGERGICGLAEFYGLRDDVHKISIGYRLLERCWGRGIATETARAMVDYLYDQTDTEIVTASTMVGNAASARVLEKADFIRTARAVEEDWGFPEPTLADKWFC